MDALGRARSNLRREREEIVERRAKVARAYNSSRDKGERRRLGPLLDKYDDHLQVIDYVLNILEAEKEVVCQD